MWVVYNHDRAEIRLPGTARSGPRVKHTRSFGQ